MSENLKVSVVIPTYGNRGTLARAVESVLNQDYKNIEILVVDDNSPESSSRKYTEEIMKQFLDDSRVKYIKHSKNMERSTARNTGIFNSTGQYLMFLDDDDEFLSGKISLQLSFFNNNPIDYGCCYTSYIRKNSKGKIITFNGENRYGNLLVDALSRNLFIHAGSNLMVKKSVIDEVGGFNVNISANEDIEFVSRILTKYKIGYIDKICLAVNIDEESSKYFKKDVNYVKHYLELTEKYIQTVNPILKILDERQQKQVFKLLHLQILRNCISGSDYKSFCKYRKMYNISLFMVYRYFSHLFIRKLRRKSYGFSG